MQTKLIRYAFVADAIATGATGLLMAAGSGLLAHLTGIPAGFSMPVGAALIVYAVLVGWVGTRPEIPRGRAMAIIGLNALWVIGSIAVLAMGVWTLSVLGVAFVAAQAAAVALLAILQEIGLGRAGARATA